MERVELYCGRVEHRNFEDKVYLGCVLRCVQEVVVELWAPRREVEIRQSGVIGNNVAIAKSGRRRSGYGKAENIEWYLRIDQDKPDA